MVQFRKFNYGSKSRNGGEADGGSEAVGGSLGAAHGGGGRLAEIVEATKSIVTSMAGYHGRLVAQAIATTYR